MKEITSNQVSEAIHRFLDEKSGLVDAEKKLGKAREVFAKLKSSGDLDKIAKAEITIVEAEQEFLNKQAIRNNKFALDNWMNKAATSMAKSLNFSTHLSKGVHPDSKGDNINFETKHSLPNGLVGSQTITKLELDANGAATALPLAGLFNIELEANGNLKLRDLIASKHSALAEVFADEPEKSDEYLKIFESILSKTIEKPKSHELNKQLLWPLNASARENDDYLCLLPLHPSTLTHTVYHQVNQRHSEANKEARDNRKKKTAQQQPYFTLHDLAKITLGGANPQNVSQLTSKQRGKNYLLPSLPPQVSGQQKFSITKVQRTIFNNRLRYYCRAGLNELFAVIRAKKSTMEIRAQRKQALDMILAELLNVTAYLQSSNPAGWSLQYPKLNVIETYWLDPGRGQSDDVFSEEKSKTDWIVEIQHSFASWLNNILRQQFPKEKHTIDDAEHKEWFKEMEEVIKSNQRAGQGVFV